MSQSESFRPLDDIAQLAETFASLLPGTDRDVRSAVQSVLAANHDRAAVRSSLISTIRDCARGMDVAVPRGERAGQTEIYRSIIDHALIQQALIETLLGVLGPARLLDDTESLTTIDSTGMLTRLGRWPEHVPFASQSATQAAQEFKARYSHVEIRQIQVFGLGGSGAPHDIAAEVIDNWRKTRVRIDVVHADAPNPDYTDRNTLVVVASFSGNTEETLNCYDVVRDKAGAVLAIGQGGKLRQATRRDGVPFLQLPDDPGHGAYVLQPRESVCLQCVSLMVFLSHLGLPAGAEGCLTVEDLQLEDLVARIQQGIRRWELSVPFEANAAKRVAVFLAYGCIDERAYQPLKQPWQKRIPFVLADRRHAALAHEVRTQMHERAKLNAGCYDAPEFLHNLVESIRATSESASFGLDDDPWVYYLIRSADEEPRIGQRLDKTLDLVLRDRGSFCQLWAEGDNPLQRAFFVTQFNAYMTTYLAALNGAGPLPVPTMAWLKEVMADYPREGASPPQPADRFDPVLFWTPNGESSP